MTLHEVLDADEAVSNTQTLLDLFSPRSQPSSIEHDLIVAPPSDRHKADPIIETPGIGSVWREYLTQLSVSAAILQCEPVRPGMSTISFIVGLDTLRKTPESASNLLRFARRFWQHDRSNLVVTCGRAHPVCQKTLEAKEEYPAELALLPFAATLQRQVDDYQVRAVFLRSEEAGEFSADTLRTLELTLPLFLCSASRDNALRRVQQQTSVLRGMLDWLDLGMLVLDDKARIVTSNAAGEALIAGERLLRIAPDGSLVCRRPAESKALRSAIEQVCQALGGAKKEFVVKLGEVDDRCRLGFVLGASPTGDSRWQQHALLLVLPARPACISREMLDTLGLLPSEQRFLLSFLEANSLAEGAAKAGVSDETAKTYLKRIRSKLGVHRQIELAQLIYGQSPPLRTGSDLVANHMNGGSHAFL